MKERPILFNGDMVRAVLEGRKTQTRRAVKYDKAPFPDSFRNYHYTCDWEVRACGLSQCVIKCPYGKPGDRLWVRENFAFEDLNYLFAPSEAPAGSGVVWQADYSADEWASMGLYTRPSIHMPRWASRITLEITDVRVERLQDINGADAKAEGVRNDPRVESCEIEGQLYTHRYLFEWLWESINGSGSWDENPWVWVVEFKVI